MILYIFIDGVGFGEGNPEKNPFTKFSESFFLPLGGKEQLREGKWKDAVYLRTDAAMGIPGLPQSATGQTAIWTGLNAPQILQRHVSGFPTITLRKIIDKYSIMKVLKENNKQAAFLNCYSEMYLEYIIKHPKHASASTLIQLASGIPFRNIEDLRSHNGLYMDITHEFLHGYAGKFLSQDDEIMQRRDPYEMGKVAVKLARNYDLTLFEYFLTDKAGHEQDWDKAKTTIQTVEKFMEGILDEMKVGEEQVILTSDHGNLEDMSTTTHSVNKVPTFLLGNLTDKFKDRVSALCDIVPILYEELGIKQELTWVVPEPEK